jgi:hypothetical protein
MNSKSRKRRGEAPENQHSAIADRQSGTSFCISNINKAGLSVIYNADAKGCSRLAIGDG